MLFQFITIISFTVESFTITYVWMEWNCYTVTTQCITIVGIKPKW